MREVEQRRRARSSGVQKESDARSSRVRCWFRAICRCKRTPSRAENAARMASPAAGTSPLADILAAEGWHLDASAIANAARASKGDVDAARARLANADLCAVGVGCLPASVAAKGVRGPAVLQVVDARDI